MRCRAAVEDSRRQSCRRGQTDTSATRLVQHSGTHLYRTAEQQRHSGKSSRIHRLRTGALFELRAGTSRRGRWRRTGCGLPSLGFARSLRSLGIRHAIRARLALRACWELKAPRLLKALIRSHARRRADWRCFRQWMQRPRGPALPFCVHAVRCEAADPGRKAA